MVLIDINWLEDDAPTFDATGDIDTVEGQEAIGSYVTQRLAEATPTQSSFSDTDVKQLRVTMDRLLGRLQRQGYVGQYTRPQITRDEGTLTITVSVDGSRMDVPVDTLTPS